MPRTLSVYGEEENKSGFEKWSWILGVKLFCFGGITLSNALDFFLALLRSELWQALGYYNIPREQTGVNDIQASALAPARSLANILVL